MTGSGSLTPGKQADIVLLNVNAINTAPMVDPIGTIVVFSDTSNVDSVFVAGRAVKRHGQLVDADLDRTFRKLDESRNHILGEGGLLPDWASHVGGRSVDRGVRRDGSGQCRRRRWHARARPRARAGPTPTRVVT